MKKILPFLLLCLPFLSFGQVEAELLGTWSDDNITPTNWLDSRYNDVWGDTINGLEIAIVGSTAGTHFIDVTDPTNPTELAFVAGQAQGVNLVHRDFHSYNGYVYAVADEGATSTLQVIDMSGLPNSVEVVYDSNQLLIQAHNIFIDTSRAMMYACNGNGFELKLISLADPANPVAVASYPNGNLQLPQIHDMYVRNDTAFLNAAFSGLMVVDFTVPTVPVVLGTLTDYPQSGYNHSGWLSDDGDHYYMLDETHGKDVKTVDVSDLTDISVTALFNAGSTSNQIAHNAIVTGDYLYVSYYFDGLQVYDVSDPDNPERIAYYDTFDGVSDGGYQGAWGIYPLLPSGNILLSDMNNGLFVFGDVTNLVDVSLNTSVDEIEACLNEELSFTLTVGDDFSADGAALSATGAPAGAVVSFSNNPAMPGEVVTVTVSNLQETGNFSLTLTAADADNSTTTEVQMALADTPNSAILTTPMNEAEEVSLMPNFVWEAADFADSYTLDIAMDEVDFDNSIFFSTNVGATNFTLTNDLDPDIYFWRITTSGNCGEAVSEIFTFTTEDFNGVTELVIDGLKIFPNPVKDLFFVTMDAAENVDFQATILNTQGQILLQKSLQHSQSIEVADFPKGVYWLKISNENGVVTEKILVQ